MLVAKLMSWPVSSAQSRIVSYRSAFAPSRLLRMKLVFRFVYYSFVLFTVNSLVSTGVAHSARLTVPGAHVAEVLLGAETTD